MDTLMAPTIGQVGEAYLEAAAAGRHKADSTAPKSKTTLELERTYFLRQVRPRIGGLALADLSAEHLQRTIDEIAETTSGGAAISTRDLLKRIFDFAVLQRIVDESPAAKLRAPEKGRRETEITDRMLGLVWRDLRYEASVASMRSQPVLAAVQVLLLTGAHRDEVAGMLRADVDVDNREWRVQAVASGEQPAPIPLPNSAMTIIAGAIRIGNEMFDGVPSVFPSMTSEHRGNRPVLGETLASASLHSMKRLGLEGVRLQDLRNAVIERLPKRLYLEAVEGWSQKLDRLAADA